MHPRQARLIQYARILSSATDKTAAAKVLWRYTDGEGKSFWLPDKKVSVYSPYDGKRFTAKPERMSLTEVGKEIKTAATVLWKYADPDGSEFYLAEKVLTLRSPYTGKSFKATPERMSLTDVGQELKQDEEAEADKTASGQSKTAAALVLWKYVDPEGKEFYLPEKMLTIRSPYTGKTFKAKPERMSMSDVRQELKQDQAQKQASRWRA